MTGAFLGLIPAVPRYNIRGIPQILFSKMCRPISGKAPKSVDEPASGRPRLEFPHPPRPMFPSPSGAARLEL